MTKIVFYLFSYQIPLPIVPKFIKERKRKRTNKWRTRQIEHR